MPTPTPPTPPTSPARLPAERPQTLHPYVHLQDFRGGRLPYPSQVPDWLRHLVRWGDDAHSPVLGIVVVHRLVPETIVLTTTATAEGISMLAEFGEQWIGWHTLVLVVARVSALTGPPPERGFDPGPTPGPTPGLSPGPAAVVPTPADVEVLLSARDTLRPLIEGRWDAEHRDTMLVTEQNAWSLHCEVTCPRCPVRRGLRPACWQAARRADEPDSADSADGPDSPHGRGGADGADGRAEP